MRQQASSITHARAQALRREMTDAERLLWSRLRMEQLGVKFRRQHPLGPYIADFACLNPRLVIELDGSQHAQQVGYDARRDAFFRSHGFRVLRYPSNAPMTNLEGLLQDIALKLSAAAPPPQPSPGGGGSKTRLQELP